MADRDSEEVRADGGSPGLVDRGRSVLERVRSDPGVTDQRLVAARDGERRTVERHSLGNRVTHWLQTALFVVLLWTGVAIWSGYYLVLDQGIWGGYYVAFGLHMWAGIFMPAVSFVLFPFYYSFVDRHHQLPELSDVQILVSILEAFGGLREYLPYYHDARRGYDEGEGDWITHHPAQKGFYWGVNLFLALLALTGFGMFRTMVADPAWWVVAFGFVETWFTFEFLKQVHLLAAFLSTAMVVFHVYFAVLPSNWDILGSMVSGDVKAYVVGGDENPSDGGEPTDD